MKASILSIAAILAPFVAAMPIVDVTVHVTDDTQHTISQKTTSSIGITKEQIPGWVFVEEDTFRARIHGNTFWNIKGSLAAKFPLEDFLFDPLLFTLDQPDDFEGDFNGTIGQGRISLEWPKSGATILGRSPVGDFEIKGTTRVDYSP